MGTRFPPYYHRSAHSSRTGTRARKYDVCIANHLAKLIRYLCTAEQGHEAHLVAAGHKDAGYPREQFIGIRLNNVLPRRCTQDPWIGYAEITERLRIYIRRTLRE